MRLLTLCPGLLANDGHCACLLLKLVYRAPAGDSNRCQFSSKSSVGTEPFNAGPSSASSPITVATWTASHREAECPSHASLSSPLAPPQRRIPHAPYANVFHVTSSGCTPAARISWSHPLPRPRNVRQVRVRLERRGPRHLVRLHASPPPNRRVMMPRGDVRLAIWLLKVDTRRVFDSDTRSSSSHWQVRGLRSVQGT